MKRLLLLLVLVTTLSLTLGYTLGAGGTFTQTLPNVYKIVHQSSVVTITAENYIFTSNAIQLSFTASAATTDTMQINILSTGIAPCPNTTSCLFQYNLVFTSANLTTSNVYGIPAAISLQTLPASSITTITL